MGGFELVGVLSFSEIVDLLRDIPLLGDTGKIEGIPGFPNQPEKWRRPYANATFRLVKFGEGCELNRSNVRPLSLYVLRDGLARLKDHRGYIKQMRNVDIFDFNEEVCGLRYSLAGVSYLITPPFIEYSERDKTNLLVDGLHRILLAEEQHNPISVIHITGVRNNEGEGEMPVVALPVGWDEYKVRDKVPVDNEKDPKRRFAYDIHPELYIHPYFFFRDFKSLEIGGVRSAEKEGIKYS